MRRLFRLLPITMLLLAAFPAFAQLAAVTGTVTDAGGVGVPNAYLQFDLYGCGGNRPRWTGGVVSSSVQLYGDANGAVTGNVVRNDQITCANTVGNTTYFVQQFINGQPSGPRLQYQINASTFNWNTQVAITQAPVVAAPTGDTVYARLDGTNMPFTGPVTHGGHDDTGIGTLGAVTANVSGNELVGGTLGACIENGMYVAGSSCYATIAAARTAAGSNTVLIPSSYAGVDSVADGNNPVIDLRNNVFKASHFFGCAYPMTNAPGGLDCVLESNGAGDLYLSHNTHVAAATTTAVTLNIGANTNFLVGSTANFGTGGTAPIIVGRDTANEETVGTGNWSIVDGTHLSVTCAKSHGPGTTDIEQLGVTHLDPGLVFQPVLHKPSQFSAATFPPIRWNDANGSPSWYTPGINSGAFPYGAFLFNSNSPISCFTSGAGAAYLVGGNCILRNYSSTTSWRWKDSTNADTMILQDASAGPFQFNNALTPFNAGGKALGSATLPWANLFIGVNGANQYTVLQTSATAARTVSFIDSNGTVPFLGTAQSWTATQTFNNGSVAGGTAAALAGTGACATITTQTGGSWAGRATCTGTTGASTLTITPGTTAPNGWFCTVQDQTTRANLFQQTATVAASCTLTVTSVTQNDVFVFTASAF